MKRLRLLGLALMAVFALGVVVAATASAAEPAAGLLYLKGEEGTLTISGKGGAGSLTGAAGTIACTSTAATATSTQTKEHVTSGAATIDFEGCKLTKGTSKVACNTEGDLKEVILTPGTFTLFNALNRSTKVLEPGIGITVKEFTIKCGAVANVIVKGTVLGLITELKIKEEDAEGGVLHFVKEGELCDLEDKFCKTSQEKANELLANFLGVFEKAEEETDVTVTFSKMMKVDF